MPPKSPSPAAAALSLTTLLRIFLPFALGYYLSYLYRTVNAVIAPQLVQDIGLSAADLGLLTSAYFLTFAAFQVPLGLLLDRYGPRKTEAILLLFAALGAALFAMAESTVGLLLGRALIGFGVSACLMAAFKSFVEWFPPARLPLINGLQMAAGGLGALTATAPVEAALVITDWRGVFWFLTGLTLFTAAVVFLVVPTRRTTAQETPLAEQLKGVAEVFTSPVFWTVAPWTVASQAAFLSVQGLWIGPWLRDVANFGPRDIASTLLLVAASMVAGFILTGMLTERLGKRGVRTIHMAALGMLVFLLCQVLIALQLLPTLVPLWMTFGFFGTTGILCYAALSQSFPAHLAGRVNTAINLLVFIAAFAVQWAVGGLIDLWSIPGATSYAPEGYRAALLALVAAQGLGALWYLRGMVRGQLP